MSKLAFCWKQFRFLQHIFFLFFWEHAEMLFSCTHTVHPGAYAVCILPASILSLDLTLRCTSMSALSNFIQTAGACHCTLKDNVSTDWAGIRGNVFWGARAELKGHLMICGTWEEAADWGYEKKITKEERANKSVSDCIWHELTKTMFPFLLLALTDRSPLTSCLGSIRPTAADTNTGLTLG